MCVRAGLGNPQYLPLGLEQHVTFAGKVFLIVDIFGSVKQPQLMNIKRTEDHSIRFKNGSHMIGLKVEQPTASSKQLTLKAIFMTLNHYQRYKKFGLVWQVPWRNRI